MDFKILEPYIMWGIALLSGMVIALIIFLVLRFLLKKRELQAKEAKALKKLEKEAKETELEIKKIQRDISELNALIYQYNMFILAKLGGIRFETFVGRILIHLGYGDVCTTPVTNDKGADLIAVEPGGNRRVCFQCKRYSHEVGIASVQEVFSAAKYYECDVAVVITNSSFTRQAQELAERIGVDLWDGEYLSAMMTRCQTEVFDLLHERLAQAEAKAAETPKPARPKAAEPAKKYSVEPFDGTGSPIFHYTQIMKPMKDYDATSPIVPEPDPLLGEALRAAQEDDEFVSVSELMKKLDIPMDRAKKLIEEMEHSGIIEDENGPHPRRILKHPIKTDKQI